MKAKSNLPQQSVSFRVRSLSQSNVTYDIIFSRRPGQCGWFCSCPDFFHRHLVRKRSHCKHLRILTELARQAHGVRRLKQQFESAGVRP